MGLDAYLAELQDIDHEITAEGLSQLSGLVGAELEELERGWAAIPALRRHEIVTRLVEMADESVELDFYPVLRHALGDEEPMVRERAVAGLWETSDRTAIPLLIERLEHDIEDPVRASAAVALGHFAAQADEGTLVTRDRDRVYKALMSCVEDDDEPLIVRRRALESVASFRVPEVRRWIQWGFDHAEPLIRQSALYAMGRNCNVEWLAIVHGEMDSDDPGMRYEAANAARELAQSESIPYLSDLVNDIDTAVSLAALQAIGAIGGAAARRLLRGYAASPGDQVLREAAEEALGILDADVSDLSLIESAPDIRPEGWDDDDD
jgi:HEAT repeat protein